MAQGGAGTLEKPPLAKNHNQETGAWPISGCSQLLAQYVTAWAHVWTVSKLGAALPAQEPVPHASQNHALNIILKVLTPQNNQSLAWHVFFHERMWIRCTIVLVRMPMGNRLGGQLQTGPRLRHRRRCP